MGGDAKVFSILSEISAIDRCDPAVGFRGVREVLLVRLPHCEATTPDAVRVFP